MNYVQVSLLSSSVVLSSTHMTGSLYLATVQKDGSRSLFIVDIKDQNKIQKTQVYTKIKYEFVSTSIVISSNNTNDVNVLYADGSLAQLSFHQSNKCMPDLIKSQLAKICSLCHDVSLDASSLSRHMRLHLTGPVQCKVCMEKFVDSIFVKRHQSRCFLRCVQCGHLAKTVSKIEGHQRKHAKARK